MKRGAPLAGLLAVTLALGASGCDLVKKLQKAREEVAEAASTGSKHGKAAGSASAGDKAGDDKSGDAPDPDEALGEKLNHPIECINHASAEIARSRDRYLQWVKDPKVGPTGTELNVYGLYEVQDASVKKCKAELAELSTTRNPPTPELEKAAGAYSAALDAVAPLVADAYKYYDQKNYEDDKLKKGKAMHPALMKAFDDFEAADDALHAEVSKLKSGLAERELASIEKKDGKKLVWHAKKLMIVAKKVLDLGAVEDAKVDMTKLEAAIGELDTITDATQTYATQHADEAGGLHMFTFAEMPMKEFRKTAKAFFRRLRDKKPFDTGEQSMIEHGSPDMVESHQARLVKDYNALVEGMNATHL